MHGVHMNPSGTQEKTPWMVPATRPARHIGRRQAEGGPQAGPHVPAHADAAPHGHAHHDFDGMARFYDYLPVPTHPRAVRKALVGATGPFVDLGGGTGRFTRRFFRGTSTAFVVDASRPMLRRAARKRRGDGQLQSMGQALPFADRTIGAITITEAFHHFVPGQEATLRECARVLRPDGRLVIEEPNPDRFWGKLMTAGEHGQGMDSVFHTPYNLQTLAAPFFERTSVVRSGLFTYVMVAHAPQPL